MLRPLPTAPIAAGSFLLGYGVVVETGSRPLGGIVLLAGEVWCARAWQRRHDTRTAAELIGVVAAGFVASHLLGLAIGAWPAVAVCAAGVGAAAWVRADARVVGAEAI